MAVYRRSAIAVIAALFVLGQLCSGNNPSNYLTSYENKITSSSSQKLGKFLASKDGELGARTDLVSIPRSCPNLSTRQLLIELLVHVHKQITKVSSGQDGEKTAHPIRGTGVRRRIVYPIEVNNRKDTLISPSTPLECTPGETRCCRQKTTVNFRHLGGKAFDIITPLAFRSAYCRGTCQGRPSNGLCCVPTKTSPLSVLQFAQGRVEVNVLHDVVVKECGCR